MNDRQARLPIAILCDTSFKAGCDRITGALDFITRFANWEPLILHPQFLAPAKIRKEFLRIRPMGVILLCQLPPGIYPADILHVPVVAFEGVSWTWDFKPTVRLQIDDKAIVKAASDFFKRRQFKSAAYVGSMTTKANSVRSLSRGKAFESAFYDTGRTCRLFHPLFGINEESRLSKFLASLPRPCGVFAYSDNEAAEVIRLCRKLKFSVPQQFSVLGVDNNETLCETGSIAISSILPDFRGLGYASAQTLHRLLNGMRRNVPQKMSFGVQTIIERQSTMNAGAAHHVTAQIKQSISSHLAESIPVSALIADTGVSLRVAEKMFLSTTGHSIRDEIKVFRLKAAADLLSNTKDTIAAVAWKSGLKTPANLSTLFKRRYGMSPAAWRKAKIKA